MGPEITIEVQSKQLLLRLQYIWHPHGTSSLQNTRLINREYLGQFNLREGVALEWPLKKSNVVF